MEIERLQKLAGLHEALNFTKVREIASTLNDITVSTADQIIDRLSDDQNVRFGSYEVLDAVLDHVTDDLKRQVQSKLANTTNSR